MTESFTGLPPTARHDSVTIAPSPAGRMRRSGAGGSSRSPSRSPNDGEFPCRDFALAFAQAGQQALTPEATPRSQHRNPIQRGESNGAFCPVPVDDRRRCNRGRVLRDVPGLQDSARGRIPPSSGARLCVWRGQRHPGRAHYRFGCAFLLLCLASLGSGLFGLVFPLLGLAGMKWFMARSAMAERVDRRGRAPGVLLRRGTFSLPDCGWCDRRTRRRLEARVADRGGRPSAGHHQRSRGL